METQTRAQALPVIRLNEIALFEAWSKADPTERVSFDFPVAAQHGAKELSMAYAVIEPAGAIPWHADSAEEELLLVLDGSVELDLQSYLTDETTTVPAGCAVCVPAGTAHRVRNPGPGAARTVHMFAHAAVAVTFADPLMPFGVKTVGGYGG